MRRTQWVTAQRRGDLTCAMSWETYSHAFAPALPSPLRKTAPYGLPVHRLGDCAGRSPGSRVYAQLRLAFPVSQWPLTRALRLQLRGQPRITSNSNSRILSVRVPSFVPGSTRETSTVKCSLEVTDKSRRRRARFLGSAWTKPTSRSVLFRTGGFIVSSGSLTGEIPP
jgi:hypothetical protein